MPRASYGGYEAQERSRSLHDLIDILDDHTHVLSYSLSILLIFLFLFLPRQWGEKRLVLRYLDSARSENICILATRLLHLRDPRFLRLLETCILTCILTSGVKYAPRDFKWYLSPFSPELYSNAVLFLIYYSFTYILVVARYDLLILDRISRIVNYILSFRNKLLIKQCWCKLR